jgi:hypothetical protein
MIIAWQKRKSELWKATTKIIGKTFGGFNRNNYFCNKKTEQ